jgi:hypothetical protein
MQVFLEPVEISFLEKNQIEIEVNGVLCTIKSLPILFGETQTSGYFFFNILKEVPYSNALIFSNFVDFLSRQKVTISLQKIAKKSTKKLKM